MRLSAIAGTPGLWGPPRRLPRVVRASGAILTAAEKQLRYRRLLRCGRVVLRVDCALNSVIEALLRAEGFASGVR
jgi:hypothetical protein